MHFCEINPHELEYACHGQVRVHIEPYDFLELDDDTHVSFCAYYMDGYVLMLFEPKSLKIIMFGAQTCILGHVWVATLKSCF